MRILGVAGFAWEPKGTVRARAFPLMSTLAKRGHEVKILTIPYDNPSFAATRCVHDGVEVVGLPLTTLPMQWSFAPLRAIREVKAWRPDVVHVFKPKGYAGRIASRLLRAGSVPVCLDVDDWEGWGGWNEVKSYPWLVKEYIDWVERSLMRRADAVTAASRVLERRVNEQRQRADEVFYVPNGLTKALYTRLGKLGSERQQAKAKLSMANERKTILYTGHFEAGDEVLHMCRIVLPAVQKGCTLLLIGDGAQMPSVRKFFASHPEVQVRYLGKLSMERYLEAVAAADLAVFPYPDTPIYRAKCSARILDYLGMGRAVITTDLGQNAEYILSGVTGVLVPPNDETMFSNAVLSWLEDEEGRRRIGAKAREEVGRRFLWEDDAIVVCEAAYATAIATCASRRKRKR